MHSVPGGQSTQVQVSRQPALATRDRHACVSPCFIPPVLCACASMHALTHFINLGAAMPTALGGARVPSSPFSGTAAPRAPSTPGRPHWG